MKRALARAQGPIGNRPDASVDVLVAAVNRAARYVPGASCLPRSIALARVLRKKGVPAIVRLGVDTESGFTAHAWVEIDGAPLAESPHRFTPLPLT